MSKNYKYFSVERAMYYFEQGVDVICDGDKGIAYFVSETEEKE